MRNNTPIRPASTTPPSTPAQPRTRTAKGIDVPATLWIPPADAVPDTVPLESAVLPAWALRHAIDQYAKPDDADKLLPQDGQRARRGLARRRRNPHERATIPYLLDVKYRNSIASRSAPAIQAV